MNTQLPAIPRDFSQPIDCRGAELSAVIAEAREQGFTAHRMTVADQVVYRLQFWKLPPEKEQENCYHPAFTKDLCHS
jgi:hypothetical protein